MRSGEEKERRKTSINLPLADSLPPVLRILTWPDFAGSSVIKNLPGNAGTWIGPIPWVRKIPWRRKWQPTPVFLPGKRTEEPGGLQSMGSQKNWTQLNNKH